MSSYGRLGLFGLFLFGPLAVAAAGGGDCNPCPPPCPPPCIEAPAPKIVVHMSQPEIEFRPAPSCPCTAPCADRSCLSRRFCHPVTYPQTINVQAMPQMASPVAMQQVMVPMQTMQMATIAAQPAASFVQVQQQPAASFVQVQQQPAASFVQVQQQPAASLVQVQQQPAASFVQVQQQPAASLVQVQQQPTMVMAAAPVSQSYVAVQNAQMVPAVAVAGVAAQPAASSDCGSRPASEADVRTAIASLGRVRDAMVAQQVSDAAARVQAAAAAAGQPGAAGAAGDVQQLNKRMDDLNGRLDGLDKQLKAIVDHLK